MALMTATIRADSPRAESWRKVLGGLTAPIESPIAEQGDFTPAGRGPSETHYHLAVYALTSEQRARLIDHLVRRFGLPSAEVEQGIDGPHGVPILAEDVVVAVDARASL